MVKFKHLAAIRWRFQLPVAHGVNAPTTAERPLPSTENMYFRRKLCGVSANVRTLVGTPVCTHIDGVGVRSDGHMTKPNFSIT
jgi:hypothetical protein